MKLGFLILAHNQPGAVRCLVDLLAGAGHRVVVHFDKNAPADQLAEVRRLELEHAGKVRVLSEVRCVWGEWSLVEAVLLSLQEFLRMEDKPDYVHLMSGADFPIRPIGDLEEFLRRNPDRDFIECCDITQRRWVKGGLSMERFRFYFPVNFRTSRRTFDRLVRWHRKLKIRRKIPLGMTPHMGSQWWTLRWRTCEMILDFLRKNPRVIRYFRSTWIPDESFFQTVLAHVVPREEIADLQLILHHLTPTGRPYVFYADHLPQLMELPHFFVRKVAPEVLEALQSLVLARDTPIPEPAELAEARDRVRSAIDRSYEHHALVPGHAHGTPRGGEVPPALVFLTTTAAETERVRAHAMSHPNALWAGCPLALESIHLSDEMQAATGLNPGMTEIRDSFPEQFVDTLSHALPKDRMAVFVAQFGDLAGDVRLLSKMPSLRFVSSHAQLIPYELPAWRVGVVPQTRIRKAMGPETRESHADHGPWWEVRAFLRIGHYFLFEGILHGVDGCLPELGFVLPTIPEVVKPETTFHHINEDGSVHAWMMFWVDDGAFLDISPLSPAELLTMGGGVSPLALKNLEDFTVGKAIALLDSFAQPECWSDRLLLESVAHAPMSDRLEFFLRARDYWPSQLVDENIGKLVPADDASRPFFRFAAIEGTSDKGSEMDHLLESADPWNADWGAVGLTIRTLASHDPAKACQLAIQAIGMRPVDGAELLAAIEPCFPKDSKWWPVSLAREVDLGPEQKADALNSMGVSAHQKGDLLLAELCHRAGQAIYPEAQSNAWNLGLLQASLGRVDEAAQMFDRISRHYSNESICTSWPMRDGQAWPCSPWPVDGFQLPEGFKKWPRITVITPSYNQAAYLEETIQSVLRQNYPDLQYIVVDGNSSDGSKDILERYRERIDCLIIEPDEGQTQAINKGLRLADGELVAWLNSDDVYGPGALHRIAQQFLLSGADVIAGICAEHRAHTLQVINLPHAKNRDFHAAQLARIFPNWFSGMFFFQPEVFFTRALMDRVGWLDESLHYAMDYDLWMRFANAGAKLEVVPWPVAFFRVHEAQKTSRSAECIAEQCAVRNRYHPITLNEDRKCQLARQLIGLRDAEKPKIVLVGPAYPSFINEAMASTDASFSLCVAQDAADPLLQDVLAAIVWIGAERKEIPLLQAMRKRAPELLLVGWFMDAAHDPHANHDAAHLVDVIIPTHAETDDYLRHDSAWMMDAMPSSPQVPISNVVSALRAMACDLTTW